MARQASPVLLINYFFKYFFKDVLTLLLQKVNLRSKGYATQRLLRIRIGYPTYLQSKTD